jgi:ADP-ribose pyrophosphatase YjhB (NUDIX family)
MRGSILTKPDRQLAAAIRTLESRIGSPEAGLPEEVFLFVSRIVPVVNVDLLIQDERKRTLLTWRDDRYFGPGWHVPGGLIRYKEREEDRIRHVARQELGAEVEFDALPLFVLQSIAPEKRDRAHAVSLLYRCRLKSSLDERQRYTPDSPVPGQWQWHTYCPENLIQEQREYAAFF